MTEADRTDSDVYLLLSCMMASTVSHREQAAQSERPTHPFANSKNLLVVIPDDKIDVEEESRLYDELCQVRKNTFFSIHPS